MNFQNKFSFVAKNVLMIRPDSCDRCHDTTVQRCIKCDAPYCSHECLRCDSDHAARCGENFKKIQELKPKTQPNDNKPVPTQPEGIKSGSRVLITSIIDHRTVCVRPLDVESDADYLRTINLTADESLRAEPLTALPSVGDWVLATWQNIYGRAIVLKVIDADKIFCGFIDYGNVISCQLAELKQISSMLKHRRWLNKKIVLNHLQKVCLDKKQVDILKDLLLIGAKLVLMYDTDLDEDDEEADLFELYYNETSINNRSEQLYSSCKELVSNLPEYRYQVYVIYYLFICHIG